MKSVKEDKRGPWTLDRINLETLSPLEEIAGLEVRALPVVKEDFRKYFHVKAKKGSSTDYHNSLSPKLYIIVTGTGHMLRGSDAFYVREGNVVLVIPECKHKLTACTEDFEYMVIVCGEYTDRVVSTEPKSKISVSDRYLELSSERTMCGKFPIRPYFFADQGITIWFQNNFCGTPVSHRNSISTRIVYVIKGEGNLRHGYSIARVVAGDWVVLSPNTVHSLQRCKGHDFEVVSIWTPSFCIEDITFGE